MNSLTERLIKKYGSKRAVADHFGVHEETIRLWLHNGIPLEKAIDVEKRTDGFVTAEQVLREAKAAA